MTISELRSAGPRGARLRRLVGLSAAALLLAPVAGCHLLDVQTPDVVPTSALTGANALPTIRAGAIGDFAIAYDGSGAQGSGGTTEGQVLISGMLGDELINTETFPDRIQVDARQSDPASATLAFIYQNLHTSRASAEAAAGKFAQFSDTTKDPGESEMLSIAGFDYVFLGENYCSGSPVDRANPDGTVAYGTPLTTVQILDTAMARFQHARALALGLGAPGANFADLAAVGEARVFLDLGDFAGADSLAATVPTSFSYVIQHDLNTVRQQNGVYNGIRKFKRYGVADQEGIAGFPWRSVSDPRTPSFRSPSTNKGFDRVTPQWDQGRYIDEKQSVPLATGLEARLINAEVALQNGDTTTFLADLNALRASPPSYILALNTGTGAYGTLAPMDTVAHPADGAAAVQLLFAERARWLWLTSHRLNDMRRLVRAVGTRGGYGLAVNSVWPNGPYFKNAGVNGYGNDVNLPLPVTEANNPNFAGCLDRNP